MRRWKKLIIGALATLLASLGLGYAWLVYDLPPLERLSAGLALPSTRLYDRHGALLYEISAPQAGRNAPIPLERVPQHCVNAFIATEDLNYWSHPGVDPVGVLRALWINLRGGEVLAGGSTITQQTVRLLLLDPLGQSQRTLVRKLKEIILALRLQAALSKEQVLALYLNQAYFGNLAYGLEAAAHAYFNRSAESLSLAECALLVGLVQNANLYNPLAYPERAKARQVVVLNLMAQAGFISPQEALSAEHDSLDFGATPFPIRAPHFVMSAWQELQARYGQLLYHEGLDVTTTLDANWQDMAQDIARRQLAYLNDVSGLRRVAANARNAALVALDPHTGEILTMLGSPDYFDESIDGAVNVALSLRQPGSALKPFTYAAAFDPTQPDPYTPSTVLLDVRTPFVTRKLESYTPSNYALVEHGPTSIREALASSYNIPAVVALEKVGLSRFVQLMGDLGLDSLTRNTQVDLSITLGGGEVRLIDLTRAYAVLANGGQWIETQMILRVVRRSDGAVLYEAPPPRLGRRVLDERVAYLITDILSDNQARQPSFGVNSPLNIGRPAAAKTGTTTDFRDNWIIGYTPDLVVGVWVGNADNTPMRDVTGVSGAGPIWNLFMRRALVGQPERAFRRPEGLVEAEVCALSGLLPTPNCPHTRRDLFIDGTQPTQPDNFYQRFTIDTRTGLLADDSTPIQQRAERVYVVLPQEARDWAARNGIQPPPTQTGLALAPDAEAPLRLLSPDPYTIFELSSMLPAQVQRLRFTVGAPPNTQQVSYWLNGEQVGQSESAPWAFWWPLALGEYELEARALLADGTETRSAPRAFRVVEEEDPTSYNVRR